MIDFDRYTLGELAKIEELTGLSIPLLMHPGAPQMKRLAAVCVVEKKRRGEDITWAEALAMTSTQANEFIDRVLAEAGETDVPGEDTDTPDPKETSPTRKPKISRSSSSRSGSNRASTGR